MADLAALAALEDANAAALLHGGGTETELSLLFVMTGGHTLLGFRPSCATRLSVSGSRALSKDLD